ncbi:hypothetical protein Syun_004003 [Stephania yunnanensis]|uniref:Uncharacterized protein n=1 Tax=Stephania yunnanensis TaxID=152371 RepID=A0AAP0L2A6_9MAGN
MLVILQGAIFQIGDGYMACQWTSLLVGYVGLKRSQKIYKSKQRLIIHTTSFASN